MSDIENTLQIYKNLQILLSSGAFPGSMAQALAVAQVHVAEMIIKLEEKAKEHDATQQDQGQAAAGVRDEASTGRLAGSGISDQGRPSGEGESKRATEPSAGA